MLCGVLQPTTGEVTVNGRISALLELGAGFNKDFTGRDNVYMNGALMGFAKEEMDRRFDAIAEFADIGEFIEQPVKTYSSGMYVRLAFACAVNVDSDILVVDEALSVGDVFFQQKCFTTIREKFLPALHCYLFLIVWRQCRIFAARQFFWIVAPRYLLGNRMKQPVATLQPVLENLLNPFRVL